MMHRRARTAGTNRRFFIATLTALSGCAMPFHFGSPQSEQVVAHTSNDSGSTIVQVRTYSGAPTVTVVAWDSDDRLFGLRSSVALTGDVTGGFRRGDHTLYMSPQYAADMGGYEKAAIMPAEFKLMSGGGGRDLYACFYGKRCSPMATRDVSIPDSILRANRDSLVVTFFPHELEPWTITLRHDLIAAFLLKVDSVIAVRTARVAESHR